MNRPRLRPVINVLAVAALCWTSPYGAGLSHAYEPYDPYDPYPVPPDPTIEVEAPAQVGIARRTATRIELTWVDRTDVEDGYQIYRRPEAGSLATIIAFLGAHARGEHTHVDTSVEPDTGYCYFVRANRGSTFATSPEVCTYTRSSVTRPLTRVQIEIGVADFSHAGTSNTVQVRLNHDYSAGYFPQRNRTALDLRGSDFTPGSLRTYDLFPVRDLSDLTHLTVEKTGTNGLCISSLRLIANDTGRVEAPGTVIFERDYGTTSATCQWIDGNDGHQPRVSFSFEELRSHRDWPTATSAWCGDSAATCASRLFPIPFEVLEQRIEASLGDVFALQTGDVQMGFDGSGPDVVTLSRLNDWTLHLEVSVKVTIPLAADRHIRLHANLRVVNLPIEDGNDVELALSHFDPSTRVQLEDLLLCSAVGWLGGPIGAGSCFAAPVAIKFAIEHFAKRQLEEEHGGGVETFPGGRDGVCISARVEAADLSLLLNVECDDFDQDGIPNEWELDQGLDPNDPTDAGENPDGDDKTNLQEFQSVDDEDPFCYWPYQDPNYCRDCGPCLSGMADCDSDWECEGERVCGHNTGLYYGLPSYYDVCQCRLPVGDPDYCRECGPCPPASGDCDGDHECGEGATCSPNVGTAYGLPHYYDICECALPPGHDDYCKFCGPCNPYEGDCDNDEECGGVATCVADVGSDYGLPRNADVCLCPPHVTCPRLPLGL